MTPVTGRPPASKAGRRTTRAAEAQVVPHRAEGDRPGEDQATWSCIRRVEPSSTGSEEDRPRRMEAQGQVADSRRRPTGRPPGAAAPGASARPERIPGGNAGAKDDSREDERLSSRQLFPGGGETAETTPAAPTGTSCRTGGKRPGRGQWSPAVVIDSECNRVG